jgi:hypothetical protein
MSRSHFKTLVALALLAEPSAFVFAQGIRQERVAFKAGSSSATLSGTIKGDETVDYLLNARSGQSMIVTLKTSNKASYFNVLPPRSEAAIAIGANIGNEWTGALPVNGDYRIRVYLMRSAARRNETATYTLSVGISGSSEAKAAGTPHPSSDAKVAGTPYHATGKVPCSVGPDPKGSAQCSFGVIRGARGDAEVHLADPGFDVSLHKDQLRILRFAGDKVTSANAKEKVVATRQGDTWQISVDNYFYYTIPEAAIIGG